MVRNNLNSLFNSYFFPVLLTLLGAVLGVLMKEMEPSDLIPSYVFDIANYRVSVWKLIILFGLILIARAIYIQYRNKRYITAVSPKTKLMQSIINSYGLSSDMRYKKVNEIFRFKYGLKVVNEKFIVFDIEPYCINTHDYPIKMNIQYGGDYKCLSCGKTVSYINCKDMENRTISDLENRYDQKIS